MRKVIQTTIIAVCLGMLAGCAHPEKEAIRPDVLPMATAPATEAGLVLLEPGLTTGDAEMRAVLAPFAAEVAKLDTPIAETSVAMEIHTPELGNFVTDRMLEIASRIVGKPVDAAFTNFGGIRDSLPKGPISYISISQVLPFENTLVVMSLTGDQLYTVTEVLLKGKGNHPITGFTVEVNEDWTIKEIKVGGQPLDRARVYTVATNNFLANGGGGMELLAGFPQQDTGVILRDAVAEYAANEGKAGRKISPPTDLERYILPPALKEKK